MMVYKYGDIVLLDFNPVRGAEISKIRPCVVISRDVINKYSPLIVVLPITSNVEKILPYHVFLKPSKQNGLTKESKVLSEQIKSLDKNRIHKKLGRVESFLLEEIEKCVLFVLNQSR